eukprot:TRINITY_DN11682_c0_g2_i3.p1 TRINITY_DN11682_c0_g2~~TRINITY_DN11682_c0_g2_i3.p1  ORF type:complete len:253 (-),score=30.63 TRINITY_DN11682_c0_g2_i3:282-1040(-)
MFDHQLTPWLIEVNSSPVMEYSTPVTKRICKAVLEDYIKVVVDLEERMKELRLSKMSKAAINRFDTGDWQLIHRTALVGTAENANSVSLQCTGTKMADPPRRKQRPRRQADPAGMQASERRKSVQENDSKHPCQHQAPADAHRHMGTRPRTGPSSEAIGTRARLTVVSHVVPSTNQTGSNPHGPRPPTRSASLGGIGVAMAEDADGNVGDQVVLSPAQRIKDSCYVENNSRSSKAIETRGVALIQSQFKFVL